MNNNNIIKVAVVGLGTIGGGVVNILKDLHHEKLHLYAVCDKNEELCKSYGEGLKIYHDFNDLLEDNNVNLIIEVMGTNMPAFNLITKALEKGISVATANKEVVAAHYKELGITLAHTNAKLYFEASVGGVVPIINNLINYSAIDHINYVKGIMNGSTNYVLTLVQKDGYSLDDAIKQAKDKGYLEADPTADLKGLDMMRKIVILSNIAYHTAIDINDVETYSLEKVNNDFINFAKDNGYIVKYMAESILKDNNISIRIEPVLVKNDSLYSNILYENNYIEYNANNIGKVTMSGFGAGRYPTASAVVSDAVMIAGGNNGYNLEITNNYTIDNSKLVDDYLVEDLNHHFEFKKQLKRKDLKDNLDKINFYARVLKNE